MNIKDKDDEGAKELVEQFGTYDPKLDLLNYKYPTLDLLSYSAVGQSVDTETLDAYKNTIVETLLYNDVRLVNISATIGPTLTLYEITPEPGVRVTKIRSLQADLALRLAADIQVIGPIPGKGTMGIEVPHQKTEIVAIRSLLMTEKFGQADMDLPVALGKTMNNDVFIVDLAKLPHLLISGATGQGKSVCLNAILVSLLYRKHPSEVKFVLIDINKLELSIFQKIEYHFLAKIPGGTNAIITDPAKAINTLNGLCIELDQRYDLLKNGSVRHIKEYNRKFINRQLSPNEAHHYLPFIVLMIDEFSELLTPGKEIELMINRLTQLGRAVGIHLIISTQRPSINILTSTIKANFTSRLAFRVSSNTDSRTILDASGAEMLNGEGDMLFATGADIIHLQGAFVDTAEVERLSEFIGAQRGYSSAFLLPEYISEEDRANSLSFDPDELDSFFEESARLIVMYQQGSTSLIQRKLKIGYNRAGRIIDQLEATGIIGPFEGSKAREVLYPDEHSLELFLDRLNIGGRVVMNPDSRIPESLPILSQGIKAMPIQRESKPKKKSLWDRLFN